MLVGLLCVALRTCASRTRSDPRTRLRVLSYNVPVGFRGDDKRHKDALAWISAQKPDVVALQELNDYTHERLREDARAWGHRHAHLHRVQSGFHLGLTSREPITSPHLISGPGIWHGVLHARTFGIDFFVLHLAPKPESVRLPETKIVLEEVRKIQSNRASVLLGDFNSPSRLDDDYYRRESAHEAKYNVMDLYLAGGWVDVVNRHQGALTEAQASVPTLIKENRWGFWRIDYILASAPLATRCVFARVMKDPATDHLSDHYPVMADFDWP